MIKKDDYAYVLDYLPNGYPLEGKMRPVVQAVGEQYLALLELAPTRGATIAVKEKVYIGPEKRDKIYYIIGRLRVSSFQGLDASTRRKSSMYGLKNRLSLLKI